MEASQKEWFSNNKENYKKLKNGVWEINFQNHRSFLIDFRSDRFLVRFPQEKPTIAFILISIKIHSKKNRAHSSTFLRNSLREDNRLWFLNDTETLNLIILVNDYHKFTLHQIKSSKNIQNQVALKTRTRYTSKNSNLTIW